MSYFFGGGEPVYAAVTRRRDDSVFEVYADDGRDEVEVGTVWREGDWWFHGYDGRPYLDAGDAAAALVRWAVRSAAC